MLLSVIAGAILFFTYLVFATGRAPFLRIDRTGAAIVGATLMALWFLRRSVQAGCAAALVVIGAAHLLGPVFVHGLHRNERDEVSWMRRAMASSCLTRSCAERFS